jgi:lipoprotein NlpD
MIIWSVLAVEALLIGCSQQANYAPVIGGRQIQALKDNNQAVQQKHPIADDEKKTSKPIQVAVPPLKVETENEGKIYIVKNGETLYSIGAITGYGYDRLAQWNQLTVPYRIVPGQQIKLFKLVGGEKKANKTYGLAVVRQDNNPVKKQLTLTAENRKIPVDKSVLLTAKSGITVAKSSMMQEKKSIISTDNKKMLKLNFAWPIKGKIAKSFDQSNYKGIDIAGKIGQKVQAAEAGKIVYSGEGLLGFGNLIIIKHNDLYLSAYGNNSSLLVKEGEQVDKGQVVAKVGKALSKKAALHFEIRKNGKAVNPLKFLPKSEKAH